MQIVKIVTKKQLVENVSFINEWVLHTTPEERREQDLWNPKNLHSGDIGSKAHALYNFLVQNGDIDSDESDVYDLIPIGDFWDMTEFELVDYGDTWYVGDEHETYQSAYENIKSLLDDVGLQAFSDDFLKHHIDMEKANRFIQREIYEDVDDDPEAHAIQSDFLPSFRQIQYLEFYDVKIKKLEDKLKSETNQIKIDELNSEIESTREKIEYIQENPEGTEIDEDKIDEIAKRAFKNFKDEPLEYLTELRGFTENQALSWLVENQMIDMDSFIDDVIQTDGLGHTLNTYDGSEHEIVFQDTLYYILNNQ